MTTDRPIEVISTFLEGVFTREDRIDFDDLFAVTTKLLSFRSSCAKKRQGALIVKDHRIISLGYNGPRSGGMNCIFDGGESACGKDETWSCLLAIHAETNAIAFASRHGISTVGCSMYCTQAPCLPCAKLIVASGIAEFKYLESYRKCEGIDFLVDAGLIVVNLITGERIRGNGSWIDTHDIRKAFKNE